MYRRGFVAVPVAVVAARSPPASENENVLSVVAVTVNVPSKPAPTFATTTESPIANEGAEEVVSVATFEASAFVVMEKLIELFAVATSIVCPSTNGPSTVVTGDTRVNDPVPGPPVSAESLHLPAAKVTVTTLFALAPVCSANVPLR